MKPLDAQARHLAEAAARVIMKAEEIGLCDAPGQLCAPSTIRVLAQAHVELLEQLRARDLNVPGDPAVAHYYRVMGNTLDFTKHATFVVRLWDGMDGCWCDCTGAVSRAEALRVWAERTNGGTQHIAYAEISYFAIFPGATRMLWDGSEGKEMHR